MDRQERLIRDLPNSSHLISDLHTRLTSKNLVNLFFLSCSLFMQNGTARWILQRALLLKAEASFSSSSLTALICLILLSSFPTIVLESLILFRLHPPAPRPLLSSYSKRDIFAGCATWVWQWPHCCLSDPFLSSVSFRHEVLKQEIQSLIMIVLSSRANFEHHLWTGTVLDKT